MTETKTHVSHGLHWHLASGVIPGCPHPEDCVELAEDGDMIAVGDTKAGEHMALRFPRRVIAEFLADVRDEHYDGNAIITTGDMVVELRDSHGQRAVLYSRIDGSVRFVYDADEWRVFCEGVKAGEFAFLMGELAGTP